MNRLIVFSIFCVLLVVIFGLKSYKSLPVDNSTFSFIEAKENYEHKQAQLAHAEQMRFERMQARAKRQIESGTDAPEPIVVLDTPQLERGHDLYSSCIACHGRMGEGRVSQNSPKIGGQYDWYLEDQIKKIRDGQRVNTVMQPFVRRLSDQDIADLSAYIAKLPKNWAEQD